MKSTAELRKPFRQMDCAERPAESQQSRRSPCEVGEGEGQLLPGRGPAVIGGRCSGSRPAKRGVGDHPVEVFRRQKARSIAEVAADEPTAIFQGVGAGVSSCVSSQIGLNFYADHSHGRVAFRQQQTDNSNSGTEVENPLAAAWGAETGQQERIEAVPVPALRLRENQAAVISVLLQRCRGGRCAVGPRAGRVHR